MHDKVQSTETIESNIENMGNIDIVPYDQYVKQSESEVVPSDASSAVNNDYVFDEYTACAPDDSVISELNAYKERVAIYEQRAKFELTTREQEMDDQVSTVIRKSKFREEVLKQELNSLQEKLSKTAKQKQELQENVKMLKQEFNAKESKLLRDFSNLKTLKNKLENKLYIQGNTIQTAHMVTKHRVLSDKHSIPLVEEPNPKVIKKARNAHKVLYDGNEILKPRQKPSCVECTEEDKKSNEITREKMNKKQNDPKCKEKK